jgi:hypothetical protein
MLSRLPIGLSLTAMEAVEVKPQVLANRRGVAFDISCQSSAAECVIPIATLEVHFWLEPGASEARIVKCFRDGYARIRATAERKLLAHPAPHIELTPDDFARR